MCLNIPGTNSILAIPEVIGSPLTVGTVCPDTVGLAVAVHRVLTQHASPVLAVVHGFVFLGTVLDKS